MKKRKVFDVFFLCFIGLLLTFLTIDTFYPQVWWFLKYGKYFRDADWVEIYSYKSEQSVRVESKEDIKRLWKSMDIIGFKQTGYPEDDSFAYIAYDIFDNESDSDDLESLSFPIYIHESGVTLWGMPPDRDRYYFMPDLRDAVIELCEKYNIEIDMGEGNNNLSKQ